jgi:uncharacterized protein YjfI (DUF2170 family)
MPAFLSTHGRQFQVDSAVWSKKENVWNNFVTFFYQNNNVWPLSQLFVNNALPADGSAHFLPSLSEKK